MNTVGLRRRGYSKKEELIEHPDYIRFDFTTSGTNKKIYVGSSWDTLLIEDAILDNSPVEIEVDSSKDDQTYITVPEQGEHVVYIKLSHTLVRTFGINVNCSYMRWPYNASNLFAKKVVHPGNRATSWAYLDILDSSYCYQLSQTGNFGVNERISVIRVPIGSKQLYEGNVSTAIYNKIVEYDFKYKIPN